MNPTMMTSSVNLGITLVNVASSVLAADVAIKLLGSQDVGIIIGIMTFVILVFGEILPKIYCNVNPEKASLRLSRVLLYFSYAMYPFVKSLEYITMSILKLSGSSSQRPRKSNNSPSMYIGFSILERIMIFNNEKACQSYYGMNRVKR